MPTYSLADLIGKTYVSTKDASAYRLPDSSSTKYKTFSAGTPIGIVYSWVSGSNGGTWLMFYDVWNNAFYVDISAAPADTHILDVQGAQSQEQQNADNETAIQKAIRYTGYVLIGAGVVYTLTELGKTAIQQRRK